MRQFEVGKTYTMRSICDHECVWEYTVIKRTAQTVTITDGKETKTCRIAKKVSEYRDSETIYPLGQYSMAPSLTAESEKPAEVSNPAPMVTDYTISPDLIAYGLIRAVAGPAKTADFLNALIQNAAGVTECR